MDKRRLVPLCLALGGLIGILNSPNYALPRGCPVQIDRAWQWVGAQFGRQVQPTVCAPKARVTRLGTSN